MIQKIVYAKLKQVMLRSTSPHSKVIQCILRELEGTWGDLRELEGILRSTSGQYENGLDGLSGALTRRPNLSVLAPISGRRGAHIWASCRPDLGVMMREDKEGDGAESRQEDREVGE